jgi:hypothetical protein
VTLAAVAAAATLVPTEAFAATPVRLRDMPLTRDAFEQLVGRTLRMRGTGSSLAVTVVGVHDIKPAAAAGDQHRFSVLLRGTRRQAAAQGVYTFAAAGLRGFDLLVVPVDRGVSARFYQAVINRAS